MKPQRVDAPEPATMAVTGLATLVQLEGLVRGVPSQQELQFFFVNETRRLVPYRSAVLLIARGASYQVCAASSVPVLDRNTPFVRFIESLVNDIRGPEPKMVSRTAVDCPIALREDWKEFSTGYGLWCPFVHPNKSSMLGMWLSRDTPWTDQEQAILARLGETYAHAWHAVGRTATRRRRWIFNRWVRWGLVLAATSTMAIPVPMSVLAPAKVVAKDPIVVTAPIDGVIKEIQTLPNTMVEHNQVLFTYDDTMFRSDYEVAERNLDVAIAQYRKASQGAFDDAQQKADVPLMKAEAEVRETERDFAHERLMKVTVKAERPGLLLYTDKSDWIGKPVVVGQRIMELADPAKLELRIDLPVEDAIVLREGAPVTLFLNANPFESVTAKVSHASYHAEVLPGNQLAYRLIAQFDQPPSALRIGWQGTAKVSGNEVRLFTFLFRRPISAIRQWFGL